MQLALYLSCPLKLLLPPPHPPSSLPLPLLPPLLPPLPLLPPFSPLPPPPFSPLPSPLPPSLPPSPKSPQRDRQCLSLALHYLVSKTKLDWVFVTGKQVAYLAQCIQNVVTEIVRITQKKPLRKVGSHPPQLQCSVRICVGLHHIHVTLHHTATRHIIYISNRGEEILQACFLPAISHHLSPHSPWSLWSSPTLHTHHPCPMIVSPWNQNSIVLKSHPTNLPPFL